jgi:hypothetical protein
MKVRNPPHPCADRCNDPGPKIEEAEIVSVPDPVLPLDLSNNCILVVGGRPQMESLYRELVEANKGIFEYHDGRMRTGAKDLVGQVRRADLVLCCIDHISHTAALVVKKLCKKHKKSLQMLMNSSLNNIFHALLTVHDRATRFRNGRSPSMREVRVPMCH